MLISWESLIHVQLLEPNTVIAVYTLEIFKDVWIILITLASHQTKTKASHRNSQLFNIRH